MKLTEIEFLERVKTSFHFAEGTRSTFLSTKCPTLTIWDNYNTLVHVHFIWKDTAGIILHVFVIVNKSHENIQTKIALVCLCLSVALSLKPVCSYETQSFRLMNTWKCGVDHHRGSLMCFQQFLDNNGAGEQDISDMLVASVNFLGLVVSKKNRLLPDLALKSICITGSHNFPHTVFII